MLLLLLTPPASPPPIPPSGLDLRVAIRVAIVALLNGDAALQAIAPVSVVYRPTRRPVSLPAVFFRDQGSQVDDIVPLWDRRIYLDVVTRSDLDQAEEIAHRIAELMNRQPLALPGGEGQVGYMRLLDDRDVPEEDADLDRKTLTFRILAYGWNDPEPWGGV